MTEAPTELAVSLAKTAPVPAIVHNVHVGTAGWTDRTLIACKRFYPRGASSAAARLRYYASQFGIVEVDATYYSLLDESRAHAWLAATPEGFAFSVKAYSALTGHASEVKRLPVDLRSELEGHGLRGRLRVHEIPKGVREEMERRFMSLVNVLARAGRLCAVLYQLPPWVEATRGAVRRLEALRWRHRELLIAVEFRHPSWLAPERRTRVFELLKSLSMIYVAVDEPCGKMGGVPADYAVTNDRFALVRMHGRNASGWRPGTSVHERFDYLYSPSELAEWLEPVQRMAEQAQSVHVVFNNCVQDYAVVGAKGFASLFARRYAAPPPQR